MGAGRLDARLPGDLDAASLANSVAALCDMSAFADCQRRVLPVDPAERGLLLLKAETRCYPQILGT